MDTFQDGMNLADVAQTKTGEVFQLEAFVTGKD